jgi:hypothetical protein
LPFGSALGIGSTDLILGAYYYRPIGEDFDFFVIGRLHAYGFAQLPVYTDLVGNQLFPRYTVSAGANCAF